MEEYLELFEEAVKKQAEVVGVKQAKGQAKKAGLGVSREGSIVSCAGNPMIVLLRLIKSFTADGNLAALEACAPLITRMTEIAQELEPADKP
ncbi:MAG: hypothetical protein KKA42_15995 [candidate division Zixibacteria bacterium]|nr:hypothetical protein [candidate division Zixibacteria bacterium]